MSKEYGAPAAGVIRATTRWAKLKLVYDTPFTGTAFSVVTPSAVVLAGFWVKFRTGCHFYGAFMYARLEHGGLFTRVTLDSRAVLVVKVPKLCFQVLKFWVAHKTSHRVGH